MKAKKVLSILFTGLIISIIDSCCGCDDVTEDFHYSISGFAAVNIDNSGKKPVEITTTESKIPKEAYGIRLTFATEEIEVAMTSRFSLIPSVYATSCDCGGDVWHAKDSVLSVKIITVNEFDGSHPAGSDVSEYFRVIDGRNYIMLDKFFPGKKYKPVSQSKLCTDCLLMTVPAISGQHQFQSEARLSDGRILTSMTTQILLN